MNDLARVILQADGQLKTGRDVAFAALLGAEVRLRHRPARRARLHHDEEVPPQHVSRRHRDAADPRLLPPSSGRARAIVNYMFFVAEGTPRDHGAPRLPPLDE